MSKIRVHELAKELGVDNRVVVAIAAEIGIPGKLSHSNSLDPDESDQIRRAVIRQAIGTAPESQVVTKRVNKSTGETSTIVESRKGNVIRRRKKDEAEESGAAAPGTAPESINVEQSVEAHIAGTSQRAADNKEEVDRLRDSLFAEPAPAVLKETEETVEAAVSVEESVEPAAIPVVEDERKVGGPRVLGKIELPQKKAVKVVIAPRGSLAIPKPVAQDEEEEEEGAKKGLRKKTKKREFARIDLVDYESGPLRRTPKPSRQSKERSDAAQKGSAEASAPRASKRVVKMTSESINVGEFSRQMSLKVGEVIAKLMELGVLATINQSIDKETATIVAEEFGFTVEQTGFVESDLLVVEDTVSSEGLEIRPPVVTVMGHVDHGKTSLLDAIKKSSVAEKEHGGITQHIGAYSVALPGNKTITFIDTPGHEAFTAMRARGAKVTDLVVLVVAADDGVMPQTVEAINHAKAAAVPIIVAVNKVDKPNTNPDKIKKQLAEHGLNPEEWGGDTLYFKVSALKKIGLEELLSGISLLAELKELKANPHRKARGTIIEARQEKGRGPVATVLVQDGTLRVGDVFVTGAESGKIRAMLDYKGERIEIATPSTPVEIAGLSGVPEAGEDFFVVDSEAQAKQVSASRAEKKLQKEQRALASGPISFEEFARRANNMGTAGLQVILKTDMHGSLEAVKTAIEQLSSEKVKVRVLHAAVGGITESDIQLAATSDAMVIGFGVRAEPRALAEAERAGIGIRYHRIIYELIQDVKKAMAGLLEPEKKEVSLGRAEVRNTFVVPKFGTIAGCYVADGLVKRGAYLRLLRDSKVIYEGKLGTLRRFKDDVREVQSGYECGISIENYNDIKNGDVMEVFEINEVAATLE